MSMSGPQETRKVSQQEMFIGRERSEGNTLGHSPKPDTLALQSADDDETLKVRAINSSPTRSALRPTTMPTYNLNDREGTQEPPTAPTTPTLPPTPILPLQAPTPRKRGKAGFILSLFLLALLIVGLLLVYLYLSTHIRKALPVKKADTSTPLLQSHNLSIHLVLSLA